MTKEQMAVFELIWNLINGKTDRSKVEFAPQKIPFQRKHPMNRHFRGQFRKHREFHLQ